MMLYIENPTDITRKLLDLINGVNYVSGHKTNIQKSVVFLYSTSKISEREIKKQSHLSLHLKEQNT